MAGESISLRELVDQRFAAVEELSRHQWEGHRREHAEQAKAVTAALVVLDQRLETTNEWRQTFGDRDKTYATKVGIEAVAERVVALENANVLQAGVMAERERQAQRQIRTNGIVVGVGSVVLSVLLGWLFKQMGG